MAAPGVHGQAGAPDPGGGLLPCSRTHAHPFAGPLHHAAPAMTTRLSGAGGFVVLLGWRWWAPLVLAAACQLTNRGA